jgi:hypothetical protein
MGDTEDLALEAMAAAVARFGGEMHPGSYKNNAPGSAGAAATALRRINAARRATRAPSGSTDAEVAEYLYAAWSPNWVDDMTGERNERVIPFRITRRTARRIYFLRSPAEPERNELPEIGYIDRLDFEADRRCPGGRHADRCEHGHYGEHGDGPGEIHTSRCHYYDWHLFATSEAARDHLFRWQREQECGRENAGSELKRLRMAMADAHPDRGAACQTR